jgi:putative transposase
MAPVHMAVAAAVDAVYLQRPPGTIKATAEHALLAIARHIRANPGTAVRQRSDWALRKLVARHVEAIAARTRAERREGKGKAARFYDHIENVPAASRPGERILFDWLLLDVIAVHDATFEPLGRPWLGLGVDDATGDPWTIDLSFDPPSATSLARALVFGIRPKPEFPAAIPGLKSGWRSKGYPEAILTDNAKEFFSRHLRGSCRETGIRLERTPGGMPWWKGRSERLNGMLQQNVIHGLPGTTFSNTEKKGDYPSVELAHVRISTIRDNVVTWLLDEYAEEGQERHDLLSPREKWEDLTADPLARMPEPPADLHALRLLFAHVEEGTVTREGLRWENVRFHSHELTALFNALPAPANVTFKIIGDDVSHAHVRDPRDGSYLAVPGDYLDGTRLAAGFTYVQLQIRNRRRLAKLKNPERTLRRAEAAETRRDRAAADKAAAEEHRTATRTRSQKPKLVGSRAAREQDIRPSETMPEQPTGPACAPEVTPHPVVVAAGPVPEPPSTAIPGRRQSGRPRDTLPLTGYQPVAAN